MNTLIGALNEFGRWLVDCLWQVSIELAILSLAVVLVILLLRIRSPRIRHLFWCLVLAKPLAVLLLASPVSLYWYLHPAPRPAPVVAPAAPREYGPNVPYDGGMWQHMRGRGMGNYGMMGGPSAYTDIPPAAPPVKLTRLGIVAAVWLAGVAALALRLAVGFGYVVFLRWTAGREAPADTRDALRGAAARLGIRRRVAVGFSDFGRRMRRILLGKRRRTTLALTIVSVVALIVPGCVGLPAASERKAKVETKDTAAAAEAAAEAVAIKAGQPVNEIAPDGMLRKWNVMDFAVNPQGIRNMPEEYFRATFDKDYLAPLGGQANVKLGRDASVEYLNETGEKSTVQATPVSANSLGWMVSGFVEAKHGRRVVYAFCNVKSDKAQKATWYFGCGDEANIWVNGRLVHETYVPRAYCEPRQDEFKADLKQGLNTVMVKASQRSMSWEFVLDMHPEAAAPEAKENAMSVPVTSKATVKREGDTVLIEGVRGWGMGERGSSVHAAQAAIMAAVGENVSYTDLVGASALAFRMQVSKDGPCPSSPHSCCGEKCLTGSSNTIPLRVRVFEVKPDAAERVAEARKAVKESIDRGVPVQYGSEEDGIVVGYRRDGAVWMVLHPLMGGGMEPVPYDGWPWGVAVYDGRKTNMPSRHDVAVAAVRKAVTMARGTMSPDARYHLGSSAWEVWMDKLGALKDEDPKAVSDAMMGNSWIYTTLVEYRVDGAEYLRSVADGFRTRAAKHIQAAADIYEKMAKEVLTDAHHCPLTVAPTPWSLGQERKWDQAMRDEQLRRMKAAFPMEQQAIAELVAALDAEGLKLSVDDESAASGPGEATVTPVTDGVAGMVALSTPTTESLIRGARWQVEDMPLSIALRACMNVLGEDFGKEVRDGWSTDHAYDLSLSATGEAYGICMQLSKADGSMDMTHRRRPHAEDAEAYRRALEALGHEGDVLMRPDGSGGAASFAEADVRGAIVHAIDIGRPAIVQGLPRPGFYAVVTGYANSGEALSGWSCEGGGPSILFESATRQQYTNWYPVIEGVVIIKGKAGGLDARVHRRILEQAVAFLRRDECNGYLAGQAMYEAWARHFEQGPATPDDAGAQAAYAGWLDPPIWDLAERRHYARVYLDRAAPQLPGVADKLNAAAGEFAAIHDLMWDISRAGGGRQPGAGLPWLRDPEVRKTIAGLIRQAAQHDAKAADYLADAVRTLGGTPAPASRTVGAAGAAVSGGPSATPAASQPLGGVDAASSAPRAAVSPVNYDRLLYGGNGHRQDTFSLAVKAAARWMATLARPLSVPS